MSPKSIARVRGILEMMDANEHQVLRNYLLCFESRKKGHKPKTLVLLNLLLKHADDSKVVELFKKRVASTDARRMVLTRLRGKMVASLMLDVNLIRPDTYDEAAQARARVAMGKVAGQLLLSRGQRDAGLKEIDSCIAVARKFELFNDLVEMLLIRSEYVRGSHAFTKLQEIRSDIRAFSQCRDGDLKARLYFHEVVSEYGFKGLSRTVVAVERIHFVEKRADELKSLFDQTGAATIGYVYLLLQIEYHQLNGDLAAASHLLMELVALAQKNPAINTRVKMATAFANLGANELWRHRFHDAEENFMLAIDNLRPNSRNRALVTEYLFYAQFYAGKKLEAKSSLLSIMGIDNVNTSSYRGAIHSYLLACVEFIAGNFGLVGRHLSCTKEIAQDKEGWNVGARVLAIMSAMERADWDFADALIINLRQFSRDGLKGSELRARDRHILDLLLELRRHSYDFTSVFEGNQDIVKKLYNASGQCAWQIQTPELICFHKWFEAKALNRVLIADYRSEHIYHQD